MTNTAHVPKLSGRFLVGNLFEFRDDRIALQRRLARECGDAGWFRMGPVRVLMLSSAELAHELLTERAGDFVKGRGLGVFARPLLGDGLLTSEHDKHKRQRKLLAPAFQHKRIATYANVMAEYGERAAARLHDGESIDIAAEMMRLTLAIVGKTLFDSDVENEARDIGDALTDAMEYIVSEVTRVVHVPLAVPTARNRRFRRAIERLDATVYRVIRERRAQGGDRGDVLSMLLAARDEDDGTGMTDQQVRDEVMTLMLAGHETTANALAWAHLLLARHPDEYARLAAEADRVLGGKTPRFEDLPRLPFAAQVLKESMRVYPPAYMVVREAERDTSVGGIRVPRGTPVMVNIFGMHHRADYFADPEKFDPSRFQPEREKELPRSSYLPFGGGPRICIGNHFALMEGQILLATLAQRVRFEPLVAGEVAPEPLVTLRPRGGLPARVHLRAKTAIAA